MLLYVIRYITAYACIYVQVLLFAEENYPGILSGLGRVVRVPSVSHGPWGSTFWTSPPSEYVGTGGVGGGMRGNFPNSRWKRPAVVPGPKHLWVSRSPGQCVLQTCLVATCPAGVLRGNLESWSLQDRSAPGVLSGWFSPHAPCLVLRTPTQYHVLPLCPLGQEARPSLCSCVEGRWPQPSSQGDPLSSKDN